MYAANFCLASRIDSPGILCATKKCVSSPLVHISLNLIQRCLSSGPVWIRLAKRIKDRLDILCHFFKWPYTIA